jgi:hypothetical protein
MRAARRLLLGVMILFAVAPYAAKSEDAPQADVEIKQCNFDELFKAQLKYMSVGEATPICVRTREAVGFQLMGSDIRELVNVGMVSRIIMERRGENLSSRDAALQILEIARIRGVMNDRKRFRDTVVLMSSIVIGLEGRVPPSAMLAALRAAGPTARTLSDDGVVNLAAMISHQVRKGG